MKPRNLMLVLAVFVFAVMNYAIYEKEELRIRGEVVYVQLAPVDPRSLIQGDYMRLRYDINDKLEKTSKKKGYAVIQPDQYGVAEFVRIHGDEPLKENEKLVKFRRKDREKTIVPASYMIQEGTDDRYRSAEYAMFKYRGKTDYILVGLADENRNRIRPEEH